MSSTSIASGCRIWWKPARSSRPRAAWKTSDDFYPSLREAFTYDGTFYCPPKDFSTLALQYNIDMFDAAGLDHPDEDWTWEDLEEAAAALTNADDGVYGMALER
jgi:ABC-type glycerol-3-phosphate transport system substrate-binding protein